MKKVLVLAALATLVATSSFAVIGNSKHDMTKAIADGGAGFTGTTETCVFCHTPHAANTAVTIAPLWNRTNTNATGTIYQGLAINNTGASLASINQTDAPLCLSCHDGNIGTALQNAPNGVTIAAGAYTMATAATITDGSGADLSNDHPIGMNMVDGVDGEIKTIAAIETNLGAPVGGVFYGASKTMWCSSCHDVHGKAGAETFLRISNGASALCLACHTK